MLPVLSMSWRGSQDEYLQHVLGMSDEPFVNIVATLQELGIGSLCFRRKRCGFLRHRRPKCGIELRRVCEN